MKGKGILIEKVVWIARANPLGGIERESPRIHRDGVLRLLKRHHPDAPM